MEYQKLINVLTKTNTQPSKCWTRKWVEVKYCTNNGEYNPNGQSKFSNFMKKSILCDYSDAYKLLEETMTIVKGGADVPAQRAKMKK